MVHPRFSRVEIGLAMIIVVAAAEPLAMSAIVLCQLAQPVVQIVFAEQSPFDEIVADAGVMCALMIEQGSYLQRAEQSESLGAFAKAAVGSAFLQYSLDFQLTQPAPAPSYLSQKRPLAALPGNRLDQGLEWNDVQVVEILTELQGARGEGACPLGFARRVLVLLLAG